MKRIRYNEDNLGMLQTDWISAVKIDYRVQIDIPAQRWYLLDSNYGIEAFDYDDLEQAKRKIRLTLIEKGCILKDEIRKGIIKKNGKLVIK